MNFNGSNANSTYNFRTNNYNKNDDESCSSKVKSFIKNHPYIFFGSIIGFSVLIILIIVLSIVLSKSEDKQNQENITKKSIFPLEESSKAEVMEIYNNIGSNDKSTLKHFCDYLSLKASNLKEEQKVYLAYYWIINNIKYDHAGLAAGTDVINPDDVFPIRKTVCSGYSLMLKELLLAMNYSESKILYISGYSKGAGYSIYKFPTVDHAWNAVEINGEWCLIDSTWDAGSKREYYLCTPPRCFVRDHLPGNNNSLQFLEKPITVETFHKQIETESAYCKYDLEIIEDAAIQNLCGKGKVIIKYKTDYEELRVSIGSLNSVRTPAFWVTPIENGFEISVSVNEKGISQIYMSLENEYLGYDNIGAIAFNCSKEPEEKFYYPSGSYYYVHSDAYLISPIQKDLTKGQTYNFELKTKIYTEMVIRIGEEKIQMIKNGDTFKEENVYIHSSNVFINCNNGTILNFKGVGNNVDYPTVHYSAGDLGVRLFEPLIGTLNKGNTYKFELRCNTNENITITYGKNMIIMDKNNNIYSKTITIDSTTTESILYIKNLYNLTTITFWREMYSYKIE